MTARQEEVLLMLSRIRGPLTRTMIADRCDAETAKARTIRPLIERGLLREEAIDSDGRMERLLKLTPAGRELAATIRETRERTTAND